LSSGDIQTRFYDTAITRPNANASLTISIISPPNDNVTTADSVPHVEQPPLDSEITDDKQQKYDFHMLRAKEYKIEFNKSFNDNGCASARWAAKEHVGSHHRTDAIGNNEFSYFRELSTLKLIVAASCVALSYDLLASRTSDRASFVHAVYQ